MASCNLFNLSLPPSKIMHIVGLPEMRLFLIKKNIIFYLNVPP